MTNSDHGGPANKPTFPSVATQLWLANNAPNLRDRLSAVVSEWNLSEQDQELCVDMLISVVRTSLVTR